MSSERHLWRDWVIRTTVGITIQVVAHVMLGGGGPLR